MEDVKALEKQVLALEEEKEKLRWDAKRLQLTLQEISSKHEKVCTSDSQLYSSPCKQDN